MLPVASDLQGGANAGLNSFERHLELHHKDSIEHSLVLQGLGFK